MMTRNECAAYLGAHDSYCILTHARPDGDTVGSASALCLGLRALGKTAHVLENPEMPPYLAPCLAGLTKKQAADGDTVVAVDVAAPEMLPDAYKYLLPRCGLRIDHHGSSTGFTPHALVDPAAAACGEIVYDLLVLLGLSLDREMAKRLYIAVSTDTGCFRYANTTAHTYRVAAACAETGAELYPITAELFDTNTLPKLKLQSWMVENAVFLCGGQAAVCAIPKALEETVTREDMEDVPGFLRSIAGVKISATIREIPGGCKLSVRAMPGYDAAQLCARFGGGGHKGAAGATLDMTLTDAARAAADALRALVEAV